MDDIPYLLRGITQMTTASSTLISSSRYLNSPRMREWMAQELLRKNGPDLPTPSGAFILSGIIKEMQNYAEIDAMMEEERKHNAVLDRFLSERSPVAHHTHPETFSPTYALCSFSFASPTCHSSGLLPPLTARIDSTQRVSDYP